MEEPGGLQSMESQRVRHAQARVQTDGSAHSAQQRQLPGAPSRPPEAAVFAGRGWYRL